MKKIYEVEYTKPKGVTSGTFMINIKDIPQSHTKVKIKAYSQNDYIEVPMVLKDIYRKYSVWYYPEFDVLLLHDGATGFYDNYNLKNDTGSLFISAPRLSLSNHKLSYIGRF